MTLKEYMKIHHPENVSDTKYNGGVFVCPYMYGEFAHMKLPNNCNIFKSCYDCWNQEYILKEGETMETKKYIIEIPEDTAYLKILRVEGPGDLVYVKDLEEYSPLKDKLAVEARKSGYKAGYEDGRKDECFNACEKLENTVWDFTYKILDMYSADMDKCFGTFDVSEVLSSLSYKEAKEKYDSYMENKIKVGDEITDGENTGYVIYVDNASRLICAKLNEYSYPQQINMNNHRYYKTGKHNPKLAEVMREISET